MCKRRATLFTVISFFAFATLFVFGIAFGTEFWIEASLQRDITLGQNLTEPNLPLKGYVGKNGIDGSDPGAFRGLMNFGLFTGCKRFNYGVGVRDPICFKVFKEHKGVYNLNINIVVTVFILLSIIFGLVATIFGLVNTLTVPIETIHGPVGLYIWNGLGALFSFLSWMLYLSLYHADLKKNVLSDTDRGDPFYFQTDEVAFGTSYWLLVAGFCLFMLNILFVFLAQCVQDPQFLWRKKKDNDDGNKRDVGLGLMY